MIDNIYTHTLPVAYSFLPWKMSGWRASRMLMAIGLQESGFQNRAQVPSRIARSFWQFERGGGVRGVMEHSVTQPIVYDVFAKLKYPVLTTEQAYHAIEHNDVLAACFARLLLWSDPRPLPDDPDKGWEIYNGVWRPGNPHPQHWRVNWDKATALVLGGTT